MKTSKHSIEPLESRIAPAIVLPAVVGLPTVTAVYDTNTGALTLTADGFGDHVEVFQTGPATYRVQGESTTAVNTVTNTSLDVGKITALTVNGGSGSDVFDLFNLRTLTSLNFTDGGGSDTVNLTNVSIKGNASFSGGSGDLSIAFGGSSTAIGGDLSAQSTGSSGSVSLEMKARTTSLGSVHFMGGVDGGDLEIEAIGPINIAKGLSVLSGPGTTDLSIFTPDSLTIGELPSGESIRNVGGLNGVYTTLEAATITLAGGVFVNGGGGAATFTIEGTGTTKIGKLPTGESLSVVGGPGADAVTLFGGVLTLAGGIDYAGGAGANTFTTDGTTNATIGKLASGASIHFTGGDDGNSLTAAVTGNLTLAGGIDFEVGGGTNTLKIGATNQDGKNLIGKLSTGASINYGGGAGADSLLIEGNIETLSGGITFAPGDGANSISTNVPGNFSIGKTTDSESISYTGGSGGDSISIGANNLTMAGGLDVSLGEGANFISLFLKGLCKVGSLGGGVSMDIRGGADTDNDDLEAASFSLAGGVDFETGDGANDLELISNGPLSIGKFLSGQSVEYVGGSGSDLLNLTGSNVTLAGGIHATMGDGTNTLAFQASTGKIGLLFGGASIAFTSGSGADHVDIRGTSVTLAGGIQANVGAGNDGVLFAPTKGTIGKFGNGQSVVVVGTGGEDLNLSGVVTTAGSLELTGGTGSSEIELETKVTIGEDATGSSIKLTGGGGSNLLYFGSGIDLAVAGSVTFTGGDGGNTFSFNGADAIAIKGSVAFTGGTGNDVLTGTVSTLSIGGNLMVDLGAGADSFSLVADGTIGGDMTVHLGASNGSETLTLASFADVPFGFVIKGKLTIDSTATTTATTLTMKNVAVAQAASIVLGDGGDTVTIDNLNAGSTFHLDTAGGTDTVNIERNDVIGNSFIKGLATIELGAGNNDALSIGRAAPLPDSGPTDSSRVVFMGGLTVDGGDGTGDNRNLFENENDFTGGAPTITGFESSTLM